MYFSEGLYSQVRIIVLTYAKIGSSNATGALTKKLFTHFPPTNIYNIYEGNNDSNLEIPAFQYTENDRIICLKKIKEFCPNIMYVYMYKSGIKILNLAKKIYEELQIPFVIHIMDDYFEGLDENSSMYKVSIECIQKSKCCFAISEQMVASYNKLFNVPFYRVSNFMEYMSTSSKLGKIDKKNPFYIKYFGNIDKNMSYSAILDVIQAIENIHNDQIHFDIYTHKQYMVSGLDELNRKNIKIKSFLEDYPACLKHADMLIMAYNFDEETRRYLRLSCAQKLPEYLASGVPILAYGPPDIGTMQELNKYNCAKLVTEKNVATLAQAINLMYNKPGMRFQLAEKARQKVEEYFTPDQILKPFEEKLLSLALKYKEIINWNDKNLFPEINIKISIIMVVKDDSVGAQKTLQSIAKQQYINKEIIVIDGASVDGTKDVVEKFKNIIDIFVSEKDKGIYDAMNKGIKNASGEYILFMNADDIFYDELSLYALANAAHYSKCDIIVGQCEEYENEMFFRYRKTYINNSMFLKGSPLTHQAMLYRKNLHDKFGLYDTQYRSAADLKFIYTLYINKIYFYEIDNITVKFSRSGTSVKNQDLSLKESQKIRREFFPDLEEEDFAVFLRFWDISIQNLRKFIEKYRTNALFVDAARCLCKDRLGELPDCTFNCIKVCYIPLSSGGPVESISTPSKSVIPDTHKIHRYKRQIYICSVATLLLFFFFSIVALLFPEIATFVLLCNMLSLVLGSSLCLRLILKRKIYQITQERN